MAQPIPSNEYIANLGNARLQLESSSDRDDNLFPINLGNSQAGVLWEIRIAKRQHWTLGLRAATLAIYSAQSALTLHQTGQREVARKNAIAQSDIKLLKQTRVFWQHLPVVGVRLQARLEKLEDELVEQIKSLPKIKLLVRDCEMELRTATAERDAILQEHPEAIALSFPELQARYSREALMGKLAYFTAARVWASANNLPESVGQLVFEGDDSDRLELLVRELEIRHQAMPVLQAAEIARRLTALTPADLQSLARTLNAPAIAEDENRESLLLKLSRQILGFSPSDRGDLIKYLEIIEKGYQNEGSDRILDSGNSNRPQPRAGS